MGKSTPLDWRPDLYVLIRFLAILHGKDGTAAAVSRSKLQLRAGVNYDMLRRYLEFLQQKRLVDIFEEGGHTQVRLTSQGKVIHDRFALWFASLFGGG